MLRSYTRKLRTLPPVHSPHAAKWGLNSRRSLHDRGIWGYQSPREFTVPDFTPTELANRVENANLLRLVESYRRHGHRAALLDPLDLAQRPVVPALDPRRYGLAATPSREEFYDVRGILDFPDDGQGTHKTAQEIAQRLAEVYCGRVAYEFMHMPSKHERRFLEKLLERSHAIPISPAEQRAQWELLAKSEGFDNWAAKRFPNVKRYGLEGGESMMTAVAKVLDEAHASGFEDVVIGMPHRGRLNLLTQLLDLDMRLLIRKMRGLPTLPPSLPPSQFTDDVLSHLFLSTPYSPISESEKATATADPMTVHLLPNPSHLETVTPVALGFARGLQVPLGSLKAESATSGKGQEPYELGTRVLSLAIHGDAAFGGQGVVAETFNLASLPHFNAGGTIHLVVNNQLGYTTPAVQSRSSFYATDLAKMVSAPILHVNGDKVDDVSRAMKLALAYQQKFRKDVVIDLVVYRRRGHNELDEPGFTSPMMYNKIKDLPSIAKLYEQQLISDSILSASDAESFRKAHFASLDESLAAADPEKYQPPELEMPRGWNEMRWPQEGEWKKEVETGFHPKTLREIGERSVQVPQDITVHPRLIKMHMAKRLQSLEKGEGLDFATAEALAFGSLLLEGYHVRLCGQDSGRGTFSQRHAILTDQKSERAVVPLQTLRSSPPSGTKSDAVGTFEVVNSSLSEYAVVGFEQGVAWVTPKLLPIWEAQFGDFNNGAQIMLDTFLGSGETKWGMQSAMTLLLPHGYDGAGPEHSSARIERFLQLTNEPLSRDKAFVPNMHLVNVTTAAQYFHLLRRQMKREYRKPLVVFSPKGILRLPAAASSLAEMDKGTSFQPVLTEKVAKPSEVERVVLLSGKMYYDLAKQRAERKLDGRIVFVRVEEISPFPYEAIVEALKPFSSAKSVMWAQDEPENAGAWTFVMPRLQQILPKSRKLQYVGRDAMATPAPGVKQYYEEQRKSIEEQVFAGL
ncbi:dehydrogenase E1 and transketolase domain-containing protein 1 [Rhodotorula sp. JG-1b]|nr:dehydrogenase E1 and transketolase domain-containing protein 1 [Rhodotorula sp. JG-1b]